MDMDCRVSLLTPPNPGAIALIELRGEALACAARLTGEAPPRIGTTALRRLGNIDQGVVACLSPAQVWIMPHGGRRIVTLLLDRLARLGCQVVPLPTEGAEPTSAYPEAPDDFEALMLQAFARLTSPLGMAILLDQPRRWRAWDHQVLPLEELRARAERLNRLLAPPLVALVGPVNVGKSTLTNALAGREASIIADLPGTTRDYVTTTVDLGGLIVRWIDTPGRGRLERPSASDPVQDEAQRIAAELVGEADVVVEARQAGAECGDRQVPTGPAACARFWVETKSDLIPAGAPAAAAGVIRCSALTGEGLSDLAIAIREALLPQADLDWPGPWLFDERLIAAARSRP